MSNCRGLFITGTSTEVGKTYVTALIAKTLLEQGRTVGVYKPVASGCDEQNGQLASEDATQLWEAAGKPGELEFVAPQRFIAPLAPHRAAAQEGREIDEALLVDGLKYWQERSEIVLVEGAGGLMSPMSTNLYCADLAASLKFPLVVVAANVLGVINLSLIHI